MLKSVKPLYKKSLFFPALIFAVCYVLSRTINFTLHPNFSLAIFGDLIVSAPLVYLIAIRNKTVSRITVLRIVTVGLFFSTLILDNNKLYFFKDIKLWLSPIMELLIVIVIIRKFTALKGNFSGEEGSLDFLTLCRIVLCEIFGNEKFANILGSEVAVFYYVFKRKYKFDYISSFSVYKESGISIVLASITGLFLVEGAGMHLLLMHWSKTIAWVISSLSIYSCIQIVAHIKALRSRPTQLNEKCIVIRSGLLGGDVSIDYNNIAIVELVKNIHFDNSTVKIGLFKNFEKPTILIHSKKPVIVTKAFGIKKSTNTIAIPLDQPKAFVEQISLRIAQ